MLPEGRAATPTMVATDVRTATTAATVLRTIQHSDQVGGETVNLRLPGPRGARYPESVSGPLSGERHDATGPGSAAGVAERTPAKARPRAPTPDHADAAARTGVGRRHGTSAGTGTATRGG